MSAVCCPLSNDGDGPSCSTESVRTARKEHRCCECDETISSGSKYEYVTGIWDGMPSVYKTCLSCVEIRRHFAAACAFDDDGFGLGGGWVYELLWEQLEENLFPEMRAGGKCLEGLSPAAKGRLFERRLQWLEDGEIEVDGAPPPKEAT